MSGHRGGDEQALSARGRVAIVNLPNALTVLRAACVPLLAWLLTEPTLRWWCVVVFVVASITDFADGSLARRYGQVTAFGTVVDPIADKALTGVALIGLSALGELWWWVTLVILVREVGVTVLRFAVMRIGIVPASRGGKAKTVAQMIAITMFLAPISTQGWTVVSAVAMCVAVLLTVVTGADYVLRISRMRSRS